MDTQPTLVSDTLIHTAGLKKHFDEFVFLVLDGVQYRSVLGRVVKSSVPVQQRIRGSTTLSPDLNLLRE